MRWEKIDEALLSQVLFTTPAQSHAFIEHGVDQQTLTPAAVLFPVVKHDNLLSVLFTKRTAHLKDHPGQISFPGGRTEPEDINPADTALREAREEIDLPASQIKVMGYLPDYQTITGYCITPVIGLVTPPLMLSPHPAEVEEIFEVPLHFLLDPKNHEKHFVDYKNSRREFHAISYNGHFIWGATAGMIVSLSKRLSALINS